MSMSVSIQRFTLPAAQESARIALDETVFTEELWGWKTISFVRNKYVPHSQRYGSDEKTNMGRSQDVFDAPRPRKPGLLTRTPKIPRLVPHTLALSRLNTRS